MVEFMLSRNICEQGNSKVNPTLLISVAVYLHSINTYIVN